VVDLRNDSPRSRQVLETVLDVTRRQLRSQDKADQADVLRRVAQELMTTVPQSTVSMFGIGIQPAGVHMPTFTAGSATIMAPIGVPPYPIHAPSGYHVPPGGYMPFQGPPAGPQPAGQRFMVAAPTSAPSTSRPQTASPSQPEMIPGQPTWDWYGAQYQQRPPPDTVTFCQTELISRIQAAVAELRES
jgi:hypothetical protein